MDTYENEALEVTEPVVEEAPGETPAEAGTYHAEGVGQKEEISPEPPKPVFHDYHGQGVYQQPSQPQQTTPPVRRAKKKKKSPWPRRAIAAALVLAVIVAACSITAGVVTGSWQKQLQLLDKSFQEKLSVMQKEFDQQLALQATNGPVITPTVGMTPEEIYAQNLNSVVAISCTGNTSYGQGFQSSGSGFVLTADGYVVTNSHVVEDATSITVITADGTYYSADLKGADPSNDIALLKVNAADLQPVKLGRSDALKVGSQVVAIGNALGELSYTLTVGYVSGKDREISTDSSGTVINMLQIDAAINSGNSGGPLFNTKGEVIGINSAKYSGSSSSGASIEGIGFAIPMDDVSGILNDLKEYGHVTGVRLGVMVKNIDESMVETLGFRGVYVSGVTSGSAAQKAGLVEGDIILQLGGHDISILNDLTRALREFEVGQTVTMKVWRRGHMQLLEITFDTPIE